MFRVMPVFRVMAVFPVFRVMPVFPGVSSDASG